METKNHALGALIAALIGVCRAVPQRVGIGIVPVFPIANETSAAPKPTDSGTACQASCEVRYPELFGVSWVPETDVVFTETLTVGTVSIITTTAAESQTLIRTETIYDDFVPKGYTLYRVSINAAGTKVVEADITLSDGTSRTTFAYPTPWVDYPSQYHWQGILPTHDESYSSTCATETEELIWGEVTPHPLYPQPTDVLTDKQDSVGASYVPLYIALQDLPDKRWFDEAFPSESAYASCQSVAGKPAPKDISTAKYVLYTVTYNTSKKSQGVVHLESSVTGLEDFPPGGNPTGLLEPSVEDVTSLTPSPTPTPTPRTTTPPFFSTSPRPGSNVPPQASQRSSRHIVPSIPILGTGQGGQPTPTITRPGSFPTTGIRRDGSLGLDHTTPVFTFVPTSINGQPTAAPVFILPDSSETATIGQTVIINGKTTVLLAPTAVFAIVPSTSNGIVTSTPAFIISGTSTASIGQTLIFNGQTTVLAAPASYETVIQTTIFGIETSITAYVISGLVTAFPGQIVTVDGHTTTLPTVNALFTSVTTTVNGVETVIPGYLISGSTTATLGQTVTIDGTATVLSAPTDAAPSNASEKEATGDARHSTRLTCHAILLVIVAHVVLLL